MKIEITWNNPARNNPVVGTTTNPNDPLQHDTKLQASKALASAQVQFNNTFGEVPPLNQLTYRIVEE